MRSCAFWEDRSVARRAVIAVNIHLRGWARERNIKGQSPTMIRWELPSFHFLPGMQLSVSCGKDQMRPEFIFPVG